MKRNIFAAMALLVAAASGAAADSIVFDNTTTDLETALVYSANGYVQMGDLITLSGTDRSLTQATFQFYNDGSAGAFDAILRFWTAIPSAEIGQNPVGVQIGADYELDAIEIDAGAEQNVLFSLPDLQVPNTLIATVELKNIADGVDPGLENYDPPAAGSSDNNTFVAYDPNISSFSLIGPEAGYGNIYLQLNATTETQGSTTPEPASGALMAGAAVLLFWRIRKARQMRY